VIIKDKVLQQVPLAEGGEGVIFEYNNQILKIFKDTVDKKEKFEKVKRLIGKNLPKNVIKPLEVLYNEKSQFIGYSMAKIAGEEFKRLTNKKFIKMNNTSTKDLLKMLVELKNTLIKLHSQNIYISDLNDCNILFDKNYNIYFIDVDSWTIDEYKCSVCMDSFKDPLLIADNFSKGTDSYAFSILIFKILTKLHPFGGTMDPDINILERMVKKISVIDNNRVTVPKTIIKWSFISPKLLGELQENFTTDNRVLVDGSLEDFAKNLEYCKTHNVFYYSKFNECPLCNADAKLVIAPQRLKTIGGIPYILLVFGDDIKTILSYNTYLNMDGFITNKQTGDKVLFEFSNRYYFSEDGMIQYKITDKEVIANNNGKKYTFDKINKSNVIVKDNRFYYNSLNNNLVEVTMSPQGNSNKTLTKTSFNSVLEVYDDKNYLICNSYDNMKIININGYNYVYKNTDKILNYGIHHDSVTKRWLFIIENEKSEFKTFVFDKNKVIYESDEIKYSNALNNICFSNNIIFKPSDSMIKAFSYEKNTYKDFVCEIVNEDSSLSKNGKKFTVFNEKEIYEVG